jgi:hypothetical protein
MLIFLTNLKNKMDKVLDLIYLLKSFIISTKPISLRTAIYATKKGILIPF